MRVKIAHTFLVSALIVSLIIGIAVFCWHYFAISAQMSELMIAELNAQLGDKITVARIDVSFYEIVVHDAKIHNFRGASEIEIPRAKLFFSPWDILQTLLSRKLHFQSVVFRSPTIVLDTASDPPDTTSSAKSAVSRPAEVFQHMPRASFHILNGTLIIENPKLNQPETVRSIQLSLRPLGENKHQLKLKAGYHTLEPNIALEINGDMNGAIGSLKVDMLDISNLSSLVEYSKWQVTSGFVSVNMQFNMQRIGGRPQWEYLARIILENGTVQTDYLRVPVNNINFSLFSENGRFQIQSFLAQAGSADFQLQGEGDFYKQQLNEVQFSLTDFKPEQILQLSKQKLPLDSHNGFSISGHILGQFNNPTCRGLMELPRVQWRRVMANETRCYFSLQDKKLDIQELTSYLAGGLVAAKGHLEFADKAAVQAEFYLQSTDMVISSLLNDERFKGMLDLDLSMKGLLSDPYITGKMTAKQTNLAGIRLPLMQCETKYENHQLNIRFNDETNRVEFLAEIRNLVTNPNVDGELTFHSTRLKRMYEHLFPEAKERDLPGYVSGSLAFFGPLSEPVFNGTVRVTGNHILSGALKMAGHTFVPDSLNIQLHTDSLKIMDTDYQIAMKLHTDKRGITLGEFTDGTYFEGWGFVALDSTKYIEGQFNLDELDIGFISEQIRPPYLPIGSDGEVSGQVFASGTLDKPYMTADFQLKNGHYRSVENLDVNVSFHYDDKDYYLDRLEINQRDHPILHAKAYLKTTGQAFAEVTTHQFDARLVPAIIGKPMKLAGLVDAYVKLEKFNDNAQLTGHVSAVDGMLDVLTYTKLNAGLGLNHNRVNLDSLSLISQEGYQIRARGGLPFLIDTSGKILSDQGLDLLVDVTGNFPAILPKVASKEIGSAYGEGHISARLVGDFDEVMVKQGVGLFNNCNVHPLLLVNEIQNINGKVTIKDHRLTVEHAQGEIMGAKIQVTSTHDPAYDFPHFELAGLDWGVLQFYTPDEGVKAHIPKLIVEGERGKFWLQGNTLDTAVFGGSFDKPYLDATFLLSDLSFTWPSLDYDPVPKVKYGKPDFVERCHWNVKLKALNNVWYTNDFANLLIDPKSEFWYSGTYADSNMVYGGIIYSEIGSFEYLQEEFRAENVIAKFSPFDLYPYVYGRAVRTQDEGSRIYLEIFSIDPETGEIVEGGQMYRLKFALRSERPSDDTIQEILSELHHGVPYEHLTDEQRMVQNRDEAIGALGYQVGKMVLRPVLRPFEDRLKRMFNLDFLTFRPGLLENLFDEMQTEETSQSLSASTMLLSNSKMTFGKFLSNRWYVNYALTVETEDLNTYLDEKLGLKQEFFLEYNLTRNMKFKYWYHSSPSNNDRWQKIGFEKIFYF